MWHGDLLAHQWTAAVRIAYKGMTRNVSLHYASVISQSTMYTGLAILFHSYVNFITKERAQGHNVNKK